MKPTTRPWGTHQALGVASILMTILDGAYNLDQDLKGRWHVWSTPATQPDESDHVARQLESDLF